MINVNVDSFDIFAIICDKAKKCNNFLNMCNYYLLFDLLQLIYCFATTAVCCERNIVNTVISQ